MLRLLLLILVLMLLVVVPFAIWGEHIEAWLTIDGATEWMRGFGAWAWVAGVGLIALDIFLPVPASVVMAALGIIYGPVVGGLLSALGSIVAGLLGYGLCRLIGPGLADRLAGADGMARARRLFDAWGGWLVVASRWLPVLPETVSFIAGLVRMAFWRFLAALICGSLPLGFAYAGLGSLGADTPGPTLLISAIAPLFLWLLVQPILPEVARRG